MLIVPVNVAIVVIVTERFKEEMTVELERALQEVDKLINQVENRKMVKISEVLKGTVIDHLSEQAKEQTERRVHRRESIRTLDEDDSLKLEYLKVLKNRLEKEIENVKAWKEGEEILFRSITGMSLIQPGVNIREALSTVIVKVKDWVVVSISNPGVTVNLPEKKL